MITVGIIRNGATYLSHHLRKNDYWAEGEKEVRGEWIGEGAKALGLSGPVTEAPFEALRQNRHPKTGDSLTPRDNANRVAFFDVQLSAPKDVSVLAMVGGDERIRDAFAESAKIALAEMERFAAVRERRGDAAMSEQIRLTGNFVGAMFLHDTSRDLDPQLHIHAVLANATWDSTRNEWLALKQNEMLRASPYLRQAPSEADLTELNASLGGFRLGFWRQRTLQKGTNRTFGPRGQRRWAGGGRYLFAIMAGRRPLTSQEERQLLRLIRRLPPRDRVLITTQWLTGFRICEVLSLKVGSVCRDGRLVEKIGIAPRNLKGGYGRTRWVPVLPELARALESYLGWLRRRFELSPDMPLFLSRNSDGQGNLRPLCPERARRLMQAAFVRAGIANDGRLGTHTLRKTFARNVYRNAGNDLMVLKAALGHSDVSVTQRYLEIEEDAVLRAIRGCDFTRRGRRRPSKPVSVLAPSQAQAVQSIGRAA